MATLKKSFNSDMFITAGLIGFSLLIYSVTLAPTVLLADGGEFQFVPWLPGIAHPTGYPLYTLSGWLFSHLLPLKEVAWRLNFFSAVTGAGAVGIVYLIARRMTTAVFPTIPLPARRLSAVSAALIFAFGYTFWSQALIAEVYSLHALFVALVLWACLRIPAKNDESPAGFGAGGGYWLALLYGLSLTHHRTMLTMLPALAVYVWMLGWRRVSRAEGLILALLFLGPQVLYLYLPLIAPHVPYAQLNLSSQQTLTLYDNTVSGFLYHILGGVFSAEVRPAGVGLERFSLSLSFLRQQVGWAGLILGVGGLFVLRRSRALLALTGLAFLGFWAFNLLYFIGDVYVLFIPCWLLLSLWIGLGWLGGASGFANWFVNRKRARVYENPAFAGATKRMENRMVYLLTVVLTALSLFYPLVLGLSRFYEVDQSQNTIARLAWQEILAQDIAPHAILLSNDRNEIMPMWYYQYVEGIRPDLLGLFPLITTDPAMSTVGSLLDESLASGRPVYFVKPMPGLEIKANVKPLTPGQFSQLIEVKAPKREPDIAVNLNFADTLVISGYDLIEGQNALTVTLYWQTGSNPPQENYTTYLHLVGSARQGLSQSEDRQPGGVYYPSSLWRAGEILRDTHTLVIPDDLPPGEYSLVAGAYLQPEPGVIEPLGEGQILMKIEK